MSNVGDEHVVAAKWLMRYLAGSADMGITYHGSDEYLVSGGYDTRDKLIASVDADLGGCLDTNKSTSEIVVMLNGGAISWRSKRMQVVSTPPPSSTRVLNAHAPAPRATSPARSAAPPPPRELDWPSPPLPKRPDQARGKDGARPRPRWPTFSRRSRAGSRRRSLKPGRRPRQPATSARAPTVAPTACPPPFTNPTTDHDRTVTLGTQARAARQPHYIPQGPGQPDPQLAIQLHQNAEHDKHTPVLTQDGPLGVGRGKETSARGAYELAPRTLVLWGVAFPM